jgi:hypothetical protein
VLRQRVQTPAPPQVDLPDWAPWLPRVTGRIELVVKPAPGVSP